MPETEHNDIENALEEEQGAEDELEGLEVTVERLRREFNVDTNVAAPQVAYYETITRAVRHEVKFKRQVVDLDRGDFFQLPLLYITGHGHFSFSTRGAEALRRYLLAGGMLFADACCGNLSFDESFRREITKVFPRRRLRPIPPNRHIFRSLFQIREIAYTPLVQFQNPDLNLPMLEGIEINGKLAVVYSRYDLGNGWEGEPRPFAKGWDRVDALKFGINLVVYAQTH